MKKYNNTEQEGKTMKFNKVLLVIIVALIAFLSIVCIVKAQTYDGKPCQTKMVNDTLYYKLDGEKTWHSVTDDQWDYYRNSKDPIVYSPPLPDMSDTLKVEWLGRVAFLTKFKMDMWFTGAYFKDDSSGECFISSGKPSTKIGLRSDGVVVWKKIKKDDVK
jgi:hypothetical protein